MNKLSTMLIASATVLMIGAGSAFACDDGYIASQVHGHRDTINLTTDGDGTYASIMQKGNDHEFDGNIDGACNSVVAGQVDSGDYGTVVIKGINNGVGLSQRDGAVGNVDIAGRGNNVALNQHGGQANVDVTGGGNTINISN